MISQFDYGFVPTPTGIVPMEGTKPEKDGDKRWVGNEETSEGTCSGTSFALNTTSETNSSGDNKTAEAKGKKKKVKKCLAEIKSLLKSDNTHGTLETLQSFLDKLKKGDQGTVLSTTTGSSSSCIWLPHTSNKYQKPKSKLNESSDVFDSAVECMFQSETNPSTISEIQLSKLTEKEVHKAYVSMSYFSSIHRFLDNDNKFQAGACLDSFIEDSIVDDKDMDVLTSNSCNSSTKAILLGELEPLNQSPPSISQWSENPAHHITPMKESPDECHDLEMNFREGQCNASTSVVNLTEENLFKHQITERRNYLKTIGRNKDLKRLYYSISARSKSFQGVRKRKIAPENNNSSCMKVMKSNSGYPLQMSNTTIVSHQPQTMGHLDNIMNSSVSNYSSLLSQHNQFSHMFGQDQPHLNNLNFPVFNQAVPLPGDKNLPFGFPMKSHFPSLSNMTVNNPFRFGLSNRFPSSSMKVPFSTYRSDFKSSCPSNILNSHTNTVMDQSSYRSNIHDSNTNTVMDQSSYPINIHSHASLNNTGMDQHQNTLFQSWRDCNSPLPQKKANPINVNDYKGNASLHSKSAVHPFWLDSVSSTVENFSEYEVNLFEDEEQFCKRFAGLNQSNQLLTQVMQYELDKIDMDLDKESDNSSCLFTPCRSKANLETDLKKMLSYKKGRSQCSSTETDSIGNVKPTGLYPHSRTYSKPHRKNKHSHIKNKDSVKVKTKEPNLSVIVTGPPPIDTEQSNMLEENATLSDNSKCSSGGMKSEPTDSIKEGGSLHNGSSGRSTTVSGVGYEGSEESLGNYEASSGDDACINKMYHNKLATTAIRIDPVLQGDSQQTGVKTALIDLQNQSPKDLSKESVKAAMNLYNVTIADLVEDDTTVCPKGGAECPSSVKSIGIHNGDNPQQKSPVDVNIEADGSSVSSMSMKGSDCSLDKVSHSSSCLDSYSSCSMQSDSESQKKSDA